MTKVKHGLTARTLLLGGTALAAFPLIVAMPAAAQEIVTTEAAASEMDEVRELERVVTTGSLIRGVAPVGTNTVSIGQEAIEASGATNTNQVLATLPLITNAFNTNTVTLSDVGTTTFRPNIRNIGAAGGNSTLVLINGHNQVGAGILQTTPDSGVIPPGMLARVEVMADGGSSLYGADAIGGIVNFITKRQQEGTRIDADYAFTADGYEAASFNLTSGFDWQSGSAVISAMTRTNTELLARDRKFPRQNLVPFGGTDRRSTACDTPNFTAGGVPYSFDGSAFVPGTVVCEGELDNSIVPQERQNALYGFLTQDFSDNVTLEMTAHYSKRVTKNYKDSLNALNVTIPTTNYYFQPVPGAPGAQAATFSYSPVMGPFLKQRGELETYGITPTLIVGLGADWELRATYNYGRSKTSSAIPILNLAAEAAAAAGTTEATALNPYNVAATNPAVLASIFSGLDYGDATQTLSDMKIVADGPAFSLPGGEVRIAVGAQYQEQKSSPLFHNGPAAGLSAAQRRTDKREVSSVFAQVFVPVIGPGNSLPMVSRFEIDASLRYDDYSDFGDTTNPKLGISWGLTDDLTVRGNVGTSFNAPSLADSRAPAQLQLVPIALLQGPNFNFPADLFRPTVLLAGGTATMQPQTADTWSVGLDWQPEQIAGFSAGMTYWNIKVDDLISVAPAGFLADPFNPAYSAFLIENPGQTQLAALLGAASPINPEVVNLPALYPPGPYLFLDLRRRNYGSLETAGIDFYANYMKEVSWGTLFGTLNATHLIKRDSVLPSLPSRDLTEAGLSLTQIAATVGTSWDRVTASATFNYNAGYDVAGIPTQTSVDSYMPVNLALSYELGDVGRLRGNRLTLNVNNLFDDYPPFIDSGIGTANGSTLGRLFTLGVTTEF